MTVRRAARALAAALALLTAAPAATQPAEGDAAARLRAFAERMQQQAAARRGLTPEAQAERARLLSQAEGALARAEPVEAAALFDRASMMRHAADAELGLVRTYMQAGEYRRAVTFAAHAAGAHPDTPAGAGLYAWLLHVGGQRQPASALLQRALERVPGDAVLEATGALLESPAPAPHHVLLQPPARFAPFSPDSAALPAAAQVVASGLLLNDGQTVLAPAVPLGNARRLWLRNGLGEATPATLLRALPDTGLAVLALERPLGRSRAGHLVPERDAFPGSPGYAIEYSAAADTTPAWPLLRIGFLGRATSVPSVYELGITTPQGPRGGPVFDAAGRLVGIAVAPDEPDARDRLVLASRLAQALGAPLGPSAAAAPTERKPVDEIYEQALAITVQVIVER